MKPIFTIFSVFVVCFLGCTRVSAESSHTNLLFIYVEDLGYYTNERAEREPNARIAGLETPNLDALAKESVNFTRAFCGQSVCSPSKGAIYSGLLPHANGIWRNVFNRHGSRGGPENWIPLPSPLTSANDPSNTGVGGLHEDLPTLIEKLKDQGVYCAVSNKLHVQPVRKFPYDAFVDVSDLESVVKNAGEKPWFFWCNPGETHAPFWKSIQDKLTDPKDHNSAPTDVDPSMIAMLPWLPDTPAARIDLAQYYSNVLIIDEFVGSMMKKLEASGQADRTIVVFTGDHGIPVQRGKTSIYPAGTQVPCFVKGPSIIGGRLVGSPISQCDFNPTFLEAFGASAEDTCHGASLWPILKGTSDSIAGRQTVMTETNNSFMSTQSKSAQRGNQTAARAVCDGRFYFVANIIQEPVNLPEDKALFVGSGHGEYGDPGPQYDIDLHDETIRQKAAQPLPYELLRQLCMSDAPPEELYDLHSDPWAVRNLIADPQYAVVADRMRREMADWRHRTNDADVHPRKLQRREQTELVGSVR